MRIPLTDAAIRGLKTPARWQLDIVDKGYPGLAVRLSPGGSKTFVYVFRRHGRRRRITLGTYPAMTLAEARDAWRRMRGELAQGKIPRAPARIKPGDFEAVARLWLEQDQAGKRTVKEAARIIEKYCRPLHRLQISDITKADIRDTLNTVQGPTMRRRVYTRLFRLFNWARQEDWIRDHPMAGLVKPGVEVSRDRVLSDDEIKRLWDACEKAGFPIGPMLQILLLTGARRGEIAELTWDEIVTDHITLAGMRTKMGKSHDIPLPRFALEILRKVPRIAGTNLVFPSGAMTPITAWTPAKKQIDAIAKIPAWRIHDLRRTCATGLQRVGTPLVVTEAILGHVGSRGGVVGIYQRHAFRDEKAAAIEKWAELVRSMLS